MSNLYNVPAELRELPNWCLWKFEPDPDRVKPIKMPYQTNGYRAKSNMPETWTTFEAAFNALNMGGYDGLGFMFGNTPYSGIDLDDARTITDQRTGEVKPNPDYKSDYARQLKIYEQFDSYAERSPSGIGCHIIVRGKTKGGKRKASVEVYPDGRFFTMTGNVARNAPIKDHSAMLAQLYEEMGGDSKPDIGVNLPSVITDEEIINLALAHNTATFEPLHNGNWLGQYPSQSEADQAYMNVIAYYTSNREQCDRIFRASKMFRTSKHKTYISRTIKKAFDQKVIVDMTGIDDAWSEIKGSVAQRLEPVAHNNLVAGSNPAASTIPYPPGLMGDIARFIFNSAQKPVQEIAIAGAIGLMAGICGKAYNVSNTGLNYYILMVADTGVGKEAIASGISTLIGAVNNANLGVPIASEFIGPSAIASKQGLHKFLVKNSQCFVSIIGEFGTVMKAMSSNRATTHQIELQAALMDIYHKSGANSMYGGSAYADQEKNSAAIIAPAFSLLGETTADTLYPVLDEQMINSGLLPRFTIIQYDGKRVRSNKNKITMPSIDMTSDIGALVSQAKHLMSTKQVIDIRFTPEAEALSDKIDMYADDMVNSPDKKAVRNLWNRAHLKALKLASLIAVGVNKFEPVITVEYLNWAMNIIDRDITNITSKFESGEIGMNTDELKQSNEIERVIREYFTKPFESYGAKYGGKANLHAKQIINNYFFTQRLRQVAVFKHDKLGGGRALQRAIDLMVDNGMLIELSKAELAHMKIEFEGVCFKVHPSIMKQEPDQQ